MTKNEMARFEAMLKASVADFERVARKREPIHINGSADELDRTIEAREREVAVQNLEAASARYHQALSALQRIREGNFGICVECNEPISPARLRALPTAALCIQCQRHVDCRCAASTARRALAIAA